MSRQKPRTRCDERQRQRHGYGRGDGRGGRRGYRRRRLVGGATANPRVCVADEGGRGSRLLLDVLQLHFPERRRDVAMRDVLEESVATRAKFKKALFRTLNNRRRVVALVHSVHLAYGLKNRFFLK